MNWTRKKKTKNENRNRIDKGTITVNIIDGVSSVDSIIDGTGFVFVSKFTSLVMLNEWFSIFGVSILLIWCYVSSVCLYKFQVYWYYYTKQRRLNQWWLLFRKATLCTPTLFTSEKRDKQGACVVKENQNKTHTILEGIVICKLKQTRIEFWYNFCDSMVMASQICILSTSILKKKINNNNEGIWKVSMTTVYYWAMSSSFIYFNSNTNTHVHREK